MYDQRPVFIWSLMLGFFLFFVNAQGCSNSSSLIGHGSEFKMLQHQLRGVFTVVDDCSFRVSRFDMLSGSDVHWWGGRELISSKRLIWGYFHSIIGQSAVLIGVVALFTGMKRLGERNGTENVDGLNLALGLWVFLCVVTVAYLEYRERGRRRARNLSRGNWVLGNVEEEDDSIDLLDSRDGYRDKSVEGGGRMEIQLKPLKR